MIGAKFIDGRQSASQGKYHQDGNQNVYFVHLYGEMALILDRMRQRKGHFMKESMVISRAMAALHTRSLLL